MRNLESKKKEVREKIKNLPKSLQLVYIESDKCIQRLIQDGKSEKEAESMVLEILKESEDELKSGMYKLVIASLRMIFQNISVDEAAKSIMS
jgi:hypothetical protein